MALKDHILKLADGVSKCQENAKSLAQVIFRGLDDIADNLPEHPGGGSDVSVTQVLSSGTKTATITVDDTPTDLYAPDPTDVDVTQVQTSGTKIATITVDDTPTDLYAPSPTAPTDVDVTQVVSTGTKIATITVDNVPTDIYAPAGSGVNYSTTEQDTGLTWIDGKKIYQKTFVEDSTNTTGTTITIDVSSLNIDKCVNIFGTFDRIVSGTGSLTYMLNCFEGTNLHSHLTYADFNKNINYGITLFTGEATSTQYITILYTKTS